MIRKHNPKQKVEDVVELAAHLRSFLSSVHRKIVDGREETLIESDDLLQCPFAYGGLDEGGSDRFNFRFFPEQDVTRYVWDLAFTKAELARIATGVLVSVPIWRCVPPCRSAFMDPNDTCSYCDYEDE